VSVVEIDKVVKRFDSVTALAGVSLTFADGEFFGLLGPSGSGKTTLLRAIAGFIKPDKGQIRLDGRDIGRTPVHRREIGMVFQNYALFPHLNVFDNIAFGLSVRGTRMAEQRKRVGDILSLVHLAGMERRTPRQLSGGQQQRVALARALVTRPKLLLLDEPLGALDKRLRQQMQIELKQIQREVGITTVFVTHDQEEALTLSDRIAIFNEGQIVQSGKPSEVYERPKTAFAANFLGDANFFDGRVAAPGRVASEWGYLATNDDLPPQGQPVLLAVRPEKITISAAAPSARSPGNRLTGHLAQAVYSGMSTTYRVTVGAREVIVFEQNRGDHVYSPGDTVSLAWLPTHTVVVTP